MCVAVVPTLPTMNGVYEAVTNSQPWGVRQRQLPTNLALTLTPGLPGGPCGGREGRDPQSLVLREERAPPSQSGAIWSPTDTTQTRSSGVAGPQGSASWAISPDHPDTNTLAFCLSKVGAFE